jgi:hypothetical protein
MPWHPPGGKALNGGRHPIHHRRRTRDRTLDYEVVFR